MSRNDPHYFKVDMDILDGEKVSQLTVHELHTYIWGYWRMSVFRRSERISAELCRTKLLQNFCRTASKNIPIHTQKLHNLGLITVWQDSSVTVHGTRARHAKLRWNEWEPDVLYGVLKRPHMGKLKLPIQPIALQHDSTTVSIQQRSSQDSISFNISNPDSVGLKGQLENGQNAKDNPPDISPDISGGQGRQNNRQSRKDYISGQDIKDNSWDICNGLGIEDTIKNMSSLADMFHTYPAWVVMSGYSKTRDKLEADKSGTSEVPLQGSPLAYMWGCLRKERSHD